MVQSAQVACREPLTDSSWKRRCFRAHSELVWSSVSSDNGRSSAQILADLDGERARFRVPSGAVPLQIGSRLVAESGQEPGEVQPGGGSDWPHGIDTSGLPTIVSRKLIQGRVDVRLT
jgi:hypothetical protein